jgi:hypothetical protein
LAWSSPRAATRIGRSVIEVSRRFASVNRMLREPRRRQEPQGDQAFALEKAGSI